MKNYDDIESTVEVDVYVQSVRSAQSKRVIGVPSVIPCDATPWFVARLRNCAAK